LVRGAYRTPFEIWCARSLRSHTWSLHTLFLRKSGSLAP
jgi:hypothetical protein